MFRGAVNSHLQAMATSAFRTRSLLLAADTLVSGEALSAAAASEWNATLLANKSSLDPGGGSLDEGGGGGAGARSSGVAAGEQDDCVDFYIYLDFFHVYYLPFIISVGLVGNILSCIVFLTTHLKMRSSSYYLAALAAADFGFLLVLSCVHLSNYTNVNLFNRHGLCQVLVYASSVCSVMSVWLIVAFTVERFIAVQYPLQRPHMCTATRAKIIVVVLAFLAFASQSYVFVTAGMIRTHDDVYECEMLPDYQTAMRVINFVDTLVTLIGPFIMIVTMNTMIARNLLLFRRRFQHGTFDECLYKDQTEMNGTQNTLFGSSNNNRRFGSQQSHNSKLSNMSKTSRKMKMSLSENLPRCIHVKSSGRNLVSTKNQQNITKMLLLISSVFILLNLPSYILRLYIFYKYILWEQNPPTFLWCIQQSAMLLYYTNFSINFLLYAMCGITFRRCLWQMIRKQLKNFTHAPCKPAQNNQLRKSSI